MDAGTGRRGVRRRAIVTEPDVVAGYVASVGDFRDRELPAAWDRVVEGVRERAAELIEREGAFVVEGDAGAFVCRRPPTSLNRQTVYRRRVVASLSLASVPKNRTSYGDHRADGGSMDSTSHKVCVAKRRACPRQLAVTPLSSSARVRARSRSRPTAR